MHRRAAVRQTLFMLTLLCAVSLLLAAGWAALTDDAFRPTLGIILMALAALVAVTGGTRLSRSLADDARAMQGHGPDRHKDLPIGMLTPVGVALFVGLPLFLLGGLVYGRG